MAQRKRPVVKDSTISRYDARVERAMVRTERAAAAIGPPTIKRKKGQPKPLR